MDMVWSIMSFTSLPKFLWGYAIESACYLLNRVPSKSVPKTPYEIWTGHKPTLSHLRVWGCPAYVKCLATDKLGPRFVKSYFIGYPKETKGYYFYQPDEQKLFVSLKATFLEREFLGEGIVASKVELDEVQEVEKPTHSEPIRPELIGSEPVPEVAPVRRSGRVPRQSDRYFGFLVRDGDPIELDENDEDPITYMDALQRSNSEKWLEAMKFEMESMKINSVWTLVDPPEGVKPIGCKWIFKRKQGADGKVETYKVRLVAKGYRQRYGIDYDETFSPVAMLKSIRIMLALAAYFDYEIWQMDVRTAFLNGELEEEVYMMQPEGFTSIDESKVCRLHKSIYGLKQASRSWNIRFNKCIKTYGFVKNEEESYVYKWANGSTIVFLILYVDDILLIGNDISTLQGIKVWLLSQFSMKGLGEASYILGMKIYRDRSKKLL